jgi:hypothetical protein
MGLRSISRLHNSRRSWLTWEDAQNDAMKKLRERIVSSVAVNVSSETDFSISETVIDNMSKYRENVDVRTKFRLTFLIVLKE